MRVSPLLFACVVGCVSGDDAPAFGGTWSCQITTSVTVSGQGANTVGPEADALTITQNGGDLTITEVGAPNGCDTTAVASNDQATINGGSCTGLAYDQGTIDVTWTSGSFTVTGNTLSGNVQGQFTGTDNGKSIFGTVAETYSCTQ